MRNKYIYLLMLVGLAGSKAKCQNEEGQRSFEFGLKTSANLYNDLLFYNGKDFITDYSVFGRGKYVGGMIGYSHCYLLEKNRHNDFKEMDGFNLGLLVTPVKFGNQNYINGYLYLTHYKELVNPEYDPALINSFINGKSYYLYGPYKEENFDFYSIGIRYEKRFKNLVSLELGLIGSWVRINYYYDNTKRNYSEKFFTFGACFGISVIISELFQ